MTAALLNDFFLGGPKFLGFRSHPSLTSQGTAFASPGVRKGETSTSFSHTFEYFHGFPPLSVFIVPSNLLVHSELLSRQPAQFFPLSFPLAFP